MDKVFHHNKHHSEHVADGSAQQQASTGSGSTTTSTQTQAAGGEHPHKEGEYQKFKDYIKEDEKLEREGHEYGDLM